MEYQVRNQYLLYSRIDHETGAGSGFASGPGWFWHENGVHLGAGDVISFAGDGDGNYYTVLGTVYEPQDHEEFRVLFDGSYQPLDGDYLTVYRVVWTGTPDFAVSRESLTPVAAAVRDKTGITRTLRLDELPGAIRSIPTPDGSYQEGIAAGRDAVWNEFWDKYQKNGTRMAYNYAFAGSGWTDETFKPKYDMDVTEASTMFAHSHIRDFKGCCEAAGISVSFAKCTNFGAFMSWNSVEIMPVIDTRSCTNLHSIFNGASNLRRVDKLILKDDGTNTFGGTAFGYCWGLQHITVEGVIGQNGFDISPAAELDKESLMSIIAALKDYSGTGEVRTITLGEANLAKLTDGEKLQAVNKGWTLAGWTPPQQTSLTCDGACGETFTGDYTPGQVCPGCEDGCLW